MRAQGSGSIVLTSSTAGQWGYPYRTPYAAAKWGIVGLTKSLAMELGEAGIRVNAICPGAVEGDRMDRVVAAFIGGGVFGGGWTARFLLNGWNAQVFDPDPDAERKIAEVLDNARASYPGLCDSALPPEGKLSFHETLSEAVDGAIWVQESVPERLELKRKVYQTLQAHVADGAVIASSTSGFKPSELQSCATQQDQILVAHSILFICYHSSNCWGQIRHRKILFFLPKILSKASVCIHSTCEQKSTLISRIDCWRPFGAKHFG